MALKATIYRVDLQLSDMDRNHYEQYNLTVARHPSETDERMMVRILAFALHAGEGLAFGSGLSTEDEPALWQLSLTGEVDTWIDVGLPDERRIRKACGRAGRVVIYTYGGSKADIWWQGIQPNVARHTNLQVLQLALDDSTSLAGMAARNLELQVMVQDGSIWISDGSNELTLVPQVLG